MLNHSGHPTRGSVPREARVGTRKAVGVAVGVRKGTRVVVGVRQVQNGGGGEGGTNGVGGVRVGSTNARRE